MNYETGEPERQQQQLIGIDSLCSDSGAFVKLPKGCPEFKQIYWMPNGGAILGLNSTGVYMLKLAVSHR